MLEKIGYAMPVPVNDKDNMYAFSNGSTIGVSTGYRGDTLQSLHVSELGKISRKYPDRALEIKTGAFPAASGKSSTITVESTAEGKQGDFYEYCTAARKLLNLAKSHTLSSLCSISSPGGEIQNTPLTLKLIFLTCWWNILQSYQANTALI